MKKIDCHVHFVGGGTAQSGTWFKLKTWWDRLQARLMLKGCGIEPSAMHDDLDVIYTEQLLKLIKDSSLDALVLLAQDIAHADDGTPLPEQSKFYVPNDVVLELGRQHEEIIPAISIHPGRADAMDELEHADNRNIMIVREKVGLAKWLASKLIPIYGDRQEVKTDTTIEIKWNTSDNKTVDVTPNDVEIGIVKDK